MARDLVAELERLNATPAAPKEGRNLLDPSIFPNVKPIGRVIEDEEKIAGFSSRAKAGFVDDPRAKLKLYAEQVRDKYFPEKQVEDVLSQNMQIINGSPAFTLGEKEMEGGANYLYYRLEPEGVVEQIAQDLPSQGPALVLGSTLAGAGAAAGAASPIPGAAYLAGTAGAALGEAGGEGYRKAVGNLLFDEEQTVEGNLADVGESAAWGAGGELFFKGLGHLLSKSMARGVDDIDFAKAGQLEELANKHGVTLTPAEMSGLKSLIARQKVLSNLPESQDIIQDFLKIREEQIQRGMYNLFSDLSPVESPREGFQKGIQALNNRRQQLVGRRAKIARRNYDQAFSGQKEPVDVSPMVENLQAKMENANTGQQRAIGAIIKELTADREKGTLKSNLQALHNAKVQLDDMLRNAEKGQGSAANMNKAVIEDARRQLLGILDNASPEYRLARRKFEIMSGPINKLDESLGGDLMKLDGRKAYKFGQTLFSTASSPSDVRTTMRIIRNTDPESADAVLRGYLQQVFEGSLRDSVSDVPQNIGGQTRKKLFGSVADRRMLRAAMSPEQYRGFSDLMEVLRATSTAFSKGSDTAFNQAEREAIKEESKGSVRVAYENARSALGEPLLNRLDQIRMGKYTEDMARLITSGQGLREFRKAANVLKQTNKRGKAFWSALGSVVGSITGDQVDLRGLAEGS